MEELALFFLLIIIRLWANTKMPHDKTCFFFHLRWSKREEVDFYRCVSTYGMHINPATGEYDWTKFRYGDTDSVFRHGL